MSRHHDPGQTPTRQGPLNRLNADVYPIIAAYLPLYVAPSTLLALALTNRHISYIVIPLLYATLVLKNEVDATIILEKLLNNPSFGRFVRELHIMSDLSLEGPVSQPDVMRELGGVISNGCLPFIHTLGLHHMRRRYYDERWEFVGEFGQLRKSFWIQLKEKCPRLRALILDGFKDDPQNPWLEDSGLIEIPDIANFTIRIFGLLEHSGSDKLFHHISLRASSLRTLAVKCSPIPISAILKCDLPRLQSLSLGSFSKVDPVQAAAFFERHPSIEYLDLASSILGERWRWFSSHLPENLLPNLRHLKAHWNDVRLLAPILGQLSSLSIHESVNAQIPYLLRFILPNGLPNLKSLDIGQAPSSGTKNRNIEGSLWFESEDGSFKDSSKQKQMRTVFDSFMHSIVRATPNIEELGFHGFHSPLSRFVSISRDLGRFQHLKEFYYEEYYNKLEFLVQEGRDRFIFPAKQLANAVPKLTSIIRTNASDLPYVTAKINRGDNGEMVDVEMRLGYGMKIGYEDQAFPRRML